MVDCSKATLLQSAYNVAYEANECVFFQKYVTASLLLQHVKHRRFWGGVVAGGESIPQRAVENSSGSLSINANQIVPCTQLALIYLFVCVHAACAG